MRLISQKFDIDLPYEKFVISVNQQNECEIIAWSECNIESDKCIVMAVYSSKEKVLKVMEMLRNAYTGKNCGYHTEHGVCYHSRNDFETKVFYFPKDEDVEV